MKDIIINHPMGDILLSEIQSDVNAFIEKSDNNLNVLGFTSATVQSLVNKILELTDNVVQEFPIGCEVRVIEDKRNASQFRNANMAYNGVYSINNWNNTIFKVCGKFQPCTFDHNPSIYGAYPLSLNDKIIGYIYNDALRLIP